MCALVIVAMAGCGGGAGGASGPSDEEILQSILADWMAAFQELDIDKVLSFYADSFTSDQGGGKAEMGEFLQGAKDQGFLDDLDISVANIVIEIDGDKATVQPIEIEGVFGALTMETEWEKIDGQWLVTYTAQY